MADVTARSNPAELPQDTRLGRTALHVTDLKEVTKFYRDVVGLNVLRQTDTETSLGVGATPLLILAGAETALERHRSSARLFHVLREGCGCVVVASRCRRFLVGHDFGGSRHILERA